MKFKQIKPENMKDNPFKLIGADWMLVTAGVTESFNTMTASWGGLGILWNKQICFCVIRPTRHTYSFINKSDNFTLSFFDKEHKKTLTYCGTHSGRNVDKIKETGLTPVKESGLIYYQEARLVLACKKIYFQDIDPSKFLDPNIEDNYPQKDYHRIFVGEIIKCLTK